MDRNDPTLVYAFGCRDKKRKEKKQTHPRIDVPRKEIKFNYKVHYDARDLITRGYEQRMLLMDTVHLYNLLSYTESALLT